MNADAYIECEKIKAENKALEARLERARGLLQQIYHDIYWSKSSDRMTDSEHTTWQILTQSFLAEGK